MSGRLKVIGIGAAALLTAGLLAPSRAGAAPTGAPAPTVTAGAQDQTITRYANCDGTEVTDGGTGLLRVSRGNDISGTIAVDVTYGGTLQPGVDFDASLPDPVSIPAGDDESAISVDASKAGTITLTVEPGSGYVVGDPATATLTVTEATQDARCEPLQEQTISVGQAPAFVDPVLDLGIPASAFDGTEIRLDGDLPPGTTLLNEALDDAATTPGVYDYTVSWCYPNGYCPLSIPYRTTVVVVDGSAPTVPGADPAPATPATPVSTSPAYTG